MSFLGFVVYTYMILKTSAAMTYYHYPLSKTQVNTLEMQSSYLWLIIEQLVFISTLMSNVVYIALRSCVRHKLQLDRQDVKK